MISQQNPKAQFLVMNANELSERMKNETSIRRKKIWLDAYRDIMKALGSVIDYRMSSSTQTNH